MTKPIYALSEDDRKWIQSLIRAEVQKARNTSQRPRSPLTEDDYLAPEVYIALTPGGGIPDIRLDSDIGTGTAGMIAGSPVGIGNTPGKADCDIYRIEYTDTTPNLIPVTGLIRTVHNLSNTAIAGSTWTRIIREKYGAWIADPPVPTAAASTDLWYKVTSLTISGPGYPCVLASTTDGVTFTLGPADIYRLRLPNNEVPTLNHIYKAKFVGTGSGYNIVLGDQDGIVLCSSTSGTVVEDVTTILQIDTTSGHGLIDFNLFEASNPTNGTARFTQTYQAYFQALVLVSNTGDEGSRLTRFMVYDDEEYGTYWIRNTWEVTSSQCSWRMFLTNQMTTVPNTNDFFHIMFSHSSGTVGFARVGIHGNRDIGFEYNSGASPQYFFNCQGATGIDATVTLAKITAGGANGSLTITGGIITAYSAPT